MMKTYEKPKLVALSLSGNERLCGACADAGKGTIYNNSGLLGVLGDIYGGDDQTLSQTEYLAQNLFASADDQCSSPVDYMGYCKFSGASENALAWS